MAKILYFGFKQKRFEGKPRIMIVIKPFWLTTFCFGALGISANVSRNNIKDNLITDKFELICLLKIE